MNVFAEDLTSNVMEFCALLRREHGFRIGHGHAHDALRAVEAVGVADLSRVRCAMRLVMCGAVSEIEIFERAFDWFFLDPRTGIFQQPSHQPRKTLPDETAQDSDARKEQRAERVPEQTDDAGGDSPRERVAVDDEADDATTWMALLAKYSAAAARAEPPEIGAAGMDRMLRIASDLVRNIRAGRLRRWVPQKGGARFDLRRTLRASLHTGGDLVALRHLGHPLRNPRFVVLIDGSRSMVDQVPPMLQFAYALCQRSRRTSAFVFSTGIRDLTRELRKPGLAGRRLPELGEAWGGGTRIGANLFEFAHRHGRLLTNETFVFVFSDGLDVGEIETLERAMRDIARRCAAIVWLNPHLDSPGYAPRARGLQAAAPFVTTFAAARDAGDFAALARLPLGH